MTVTRMIFPGPLVFNSPVPGFYRVKSFGQKISVATRLNIINLDIRLKGMAAGADRTRSLIVQFNRSIIETCSFLGAKVRDIPRSVISTHRGSNPLSEFIRIIFNPCCRYILLICLIPY